MAKLGSSSCRPLLMMLLALLLLASIQAGPVMPALLEQAGEAIKKVLPEVRDHVDAAVAEVPGDLGEKLRNQAAKTGTRIVCQKPGWERSCKGVKMGLRVHKYLCKAQGWMDKLNPGGAGGTPYWVEFIGGDLLSSISTLSCSDTYVPCCSAAPQVQAATMSVRITGIRVGQEDIPVKPPAYTELEISIYGFRLREAVIKALNPVANPIATGNTDQLCYAVPEGSLPRIAVLLGSDNGGVMQTTGLSVWHQKPLMFCLGIRTTVELILGTP